MTDTATTEDARMAKAREVLRCNLANYVRACKTRLVDPAFSDLEYVLAPVVVAFSTAERASETAAPEGWVAGWNEAVEAAACVADGAYQGDKAKEAEYLASAKAANSTSGREVDLEYAVSFARRANGDADIARAIRALASRSEGVL